LESDADLSGEDYDELSKVLLARDPKGKVIQLKGEARWVVLKTIQPVSSSIRELGGLTVGTVRLEPRLTSGAIGKLKKRVQGRGSTKNGQVSQ